MLLTQGVLYAARGDFCLLPSLPFLLSVPREWNPDNEMNARKRNIFLHVVCNGYVKLLKETEHSETAIFQEGHEEESRAHIYNTDNAPLYF